MLFEVGKLLVTGKESPTPPPLTNGHTQMKADLQAKYIQFLNKKNADSNKGFTLIELLVVVIIIGVLAAIALPSFLNQTAKAKQSEAKTTISAVNSAQAQRRGGTEGSFASDMSSLSLGLATQSANYGFDVKGDQDTAQILTFNVDTALKNYTGANVTFKDANKASVTATIICEAKEAKADADGMAPGLDSTKTTVAEAAKCNADQVALK